MTICWRTESYDKVVQKRQFLSAFQIHPDLHVRFCALASKFPQILLLVAAMSSPAPGRKIILTRPVHVFYKHINVDKARDFLLDFGFAEEKRVGQRIYYRGYGPDPFVYCLEKGDEDMFGGVAFEVESEEDLEYASKTLPDASSIYELVDAPGAGKCVTFKDPVDGFPFHLVFGQTMREGGRAETSDAAELPNGNPLTLKFNFVSCASYYNGASTYKISQPEDKQRPAGKFQRFKKGCSFPRDLLVDSFADRQQPQRLYISWVTSEFVLRTFRRRLTSTLLISTFSQARFVASALHLPIELTSTSSFIFRTLAKYSIPFVD